jgi:hypothetical protein
VPPALVQVLRDGMANDPADRPTARELANRLKELERTESAVPNPRRPDSADEPTEPAPRRWSIARLLGLDTA